MSSGAYSLFHPKGLLIMQNRHGGTDRLELMERGNYLYPRDPFPSLPSSPAACPTGYLGVPAEETALPQYAQLLVPSPDSGSKVCHREQPTRAPPSPCQTAASSWDAGCRGAVELHSGAPRTCKLPMMFILQATKHFVAGSFIPAG